MDLFFFLLSSTCPDLLWHVAATDTFLVGVLELRSQVFSVNLTAKEEPAFKRPGDLPLPLKHPGTFPRVLVPAGRHAEADSAKLNCFCKVVSMAAIFFT